MATKDECAVHSHVKILSSSVRAISLSSPHEWTRMAFDARIGDEWEIRL
jgi:hypothetical protein